MITRLACLCMLCLFLTCSIASANDSALRGLSGGTLKPMNEHPSVRLVKERVTVRLGTETATVRCEFHLKNEGKACEVKMGFPEHAWAYGDGGTNLRMSEFRSRVDGRLVKMKYQVSPKPPKRFRDEEMSYEAWYTKIVKFPAGQTRVVVDTYKCEIGGWGDVSGEYFLLFSYILQTGRSWKGKIGDAVISVDAPAYPRRHFDVTGSPAGYEQRRTALVWTLRDFEPKADIEVKIKPRCPALNGHRVPGGLFGRFAVDQGIVFAGTQWIEFLGGKVDCDDRTMVCNVSYGKKFLRMRAGSGTAMLNGERIALPMPKGKAGTRSFRFPLTAVVKALGGRTGYDENERRFQVWLDPVPGVKPEYPGPHYFGP